MRIVPPFLAFSAAVALPAAANDLEKDYDRNARRAARRDAFPVLNDPKLTPAAKATQVNDREPVIGLYLNGEAQAFPVSVMGRHELLNNLCGKVPVAVSW